MIATMTRPQTGTCRDCGEDVTFCYGGVKGRICQSCYSRQGYERMKRRVEARKIPCPQGCGRKFDPDRATMCFMCAPSHYITVKERAPRTLHKPSGYWLVKVPPDDPMISMANGQRHVREHRLVMADYIGRPLTAGEHVHHKNHDRGDNRIENLVLMMAADHNALHNAERARRKDGTFAPANPDAPEGLD